MALIPDIKGTTQTTFTIPGGLVAETAKLTTGAGAGLALVSDADGDGTWTNLGALYLPLKTATDTNHYTGFPDRTSTSLSWADGTGTLTLTASADKIWISGVEYTINTLTKAFDAGLAEATGLYWFWITAPGGTPQLNYATTVTDLFGQCLVAVVYWNTTTNKGLLSDERHWMGRDKWMHEYLHETVGARYAHGLAGTFLNDTFEIEAGEYYDEDIEHESDAETVATILYHDGSSAWEWDVDSTTPYKVVGGNLVYNNGTTLTEATANRFVNYFIFATPDTNNPIAVVIGTAQYTTLADAQAATLPSLGSLTSAEHRLIYKVIYKNAGPPTFQHAIDYRTSSTLPSTGYVATDHGSLSGLSDDDHTQYALLASTRGAQTFVGTVNFGDALLGVTDTNASHYLRFGCGSDLSADRILSFVPGNAARTITLSGNPTLADWFDQSVKAAASVNFANLTLYNAGAGVFNFQDSTAAPASGDLTGQISSIIRTSESASIRFYIDGDNAANDVPGRISFWTTPDASATPAERMRITKDGSVGIGTETPAQPLHVYGEKGIRLQSNATHNYGFINSVGNIHLTQNAYFDGAVWKSIAASPTAAGMVGMGVGGGACAVFYADPSVSAADQELAWTSLFTVRTDGDVYSLPWTNYTSSVTWTGFSPATPNQWAVVYYKKIGRLVFLFFNFLGASNASNMHFSLPFTAFNAYAFFVSCRVYDGGLTSYFPGMCTISPADLNKAIFDMDHQGGVFASTGNKGANGFIIYETAA